MLPLNCVAMSITSNFTIVSMSLNDANIQLCVIVLYFFLKTPSLVSLIHIKKCIIFIQMQFCQTHLNCVLDCNYVISKVQRRDAMSECAQCACTTHTGCTHCTHAYTQTWVQQCYVFYSTTIKLVQMVPQCINNDVISLTMCAWYLHVCTMVQCMSMHTCVYELQICVFYNATTIQTI